MKALPHGTSLIVTAARCFTGHDADSGPKVEEGRSKTDNPEPPVPGSHGGCPAFASSERSSKVATSLPGPGRHRQGRTDRPGCAAVRLPQSYKAKETVVKKQASSYGPGEVGKRADCQSPVAGRRSPVEPRDKELPRRSARHARRPAAKLRNPRQAVNRPLIGLSVIEGAFGDGAMIEGAGYRVGAGCLRGNGWCRRAGQN
jgi:hypothetical protein